MKDNGGWQVIDEVFLVQGIHTLKTPKRFQSVEGSSHPRLYYFRFTNSQHDDEGPSKGGV